MAMVVGRLLALALFVLQARTVLAKTPLPSPTSKVLVLGVNATTHQAFLTEPAKVGPIAPPRRMQSAELLCPADQYRLSEQVVVLPCDGMELRFDLNLESEALLGIIQGIPVGTLNLEIDLHGDADIDIVIVETVSDECIVGHQCSACDQNGCTDFQYQGMIITFSGGDSQAPVQETASFSGATTRALNVEVWAGPPVSGYVDVTYDGIDPCPEVTPGCALCADYTECEPPQQPQCDGTHVVTCVDPTTSTTTSTRSATTTTTTTSTTIATTTTSATTTSMGQESMPSGIDAAMEAGAAAASESLGFESLGLHESVAPAPRRMAVAPLAALLVAVVAGVATLAFMAGAVWSRTSRTVALTAQGETQQETTPLRSA